MKTISLFLVALAGAAVMASAQTNQIEVTRPPAVTPPKSSDLTITFQTNLPYARRLGDFKVNYGGVASEVRRGGVRRLLEPASPSSPAHPFQNVSVNPRTGKAEGIALFSLDF